MRRKASASTPPKLTLDARFPLPAEGRLATGIVRTKPRLGSLHERTHRIQQLEVETPHPASGRVGWKLSGSLHESPHRGQLLEVPKPCNLTTPPFLVCHAPESQPFSALLTLFHKESVYHSTYETALLSVDATAVDILLELVLNVFPFHAWPHFDLPCASSRDITLHVHLIFSFSSQCSCSGQHVLRIQH